MAIIRYKALVAEKDGIELEYHEEAALDASNIFYNNLDYDNVQDGLDNVGDLVSVLVVPITLVYNGNLSNGDFIGYSNLLPGDSTPIVAPTTANFTGFTWSNSNTDADFALVFRKNSTTATPFFTWSVDNTQTDEVDLPTPESFNAGDLIFVQYIDEGQNASDAVIVLRFRA